MYCDALIAVFSWHLGITSTVVGSQFVSFFSDLMFQANICGINRVLGFSEDLSCLGLGMTLDRQGSLPPF
jgi:hypothetical protein